MGLKHEYDTKKNMKKKPLKYLKSIYFGMKISLNIFVEITSTFLEFIKSA